MVGLSGRDDRAWRGLLLVQQLSTDLSAIGNEALGSAATDNRAIQLLALLLDGPMASKHVPVALDLPAPAAYKLLRALDSDGAINRSHNRLDQRRIDIALSPGGRRRLATFESRLADYCADNDPLLAQIVDVLDGAAATPAPTQAPRPVLVMAALGTAGATYQDAVESVLSEHGLLDTTARHALCLIAASGSVRPRDVADQLGMTAGGVTALLDRLESAGHVTRWHDQAGGDRRAVLVDATPAGAKAATAILRVFAAHGPDFARTAAIARSLAPQASATK